MQIIKVILLFLSLKLLAQNNTDLKKGSAFSLFYENSWQERFEKLRKKSGRK